MIGSRLCFGKLNVAAAIQQTAREMEAFGCDTGAAEVGMEGRGGGKG